MKQTFDLGAESGEDTLVSTAALESRLTDIEQRISAENDDQEKRKLELLAAQTLFDLDKKHLAWQRARPLFEDALTDKDWQQLIVICELLFLTEQPKSLAALGHAVWLSVTFPVDLFLTLQQLQHVIDETPDESDGAAVAAAVGSYVCEVRSEASNSSDAQFQAMQMLTSVARRHSDIDEQSDFDQWMEKMELYETDKILIRLRNVIDVLIQDDWWLDPTSIQAELPE